MACLNKVVQVAARSFSCKQFGEVLSTDERCCIPLLKKVLTAVKLIWSLLSDDWSCLIWMTFYKLTRCSAASSSVTFFSTDERCSSLWHDTPTAVRHFWCFTDWSWPVWIRWYKLQPGLSAVSNSVTLFSTDERCCASFHSKKVLTVVKLIWSSLSDDWSCFSWIWLYELQPDLLAASSSVTFSRQMRGVSFFIFPQNSCHDSYQAILNFIDWWLSVSHLNEILQVTFKSSVSSSSVNFCRHNEIQISMTTIRICFW